MKWNFDCGDTVEIKHLSFELLVQTIDCFARHLELFRGFILFDLVSYSKCVFNHWSLSDLA
jgi:hypothetical protein